MAQTQALPVALENGFGELLRQWRAARKLSQLELALQCNVSQRHISFMESGRSRPSRAMVLQLAEALDVPLRERNAILHSAGYAGVFRQRDLVAAEMAPVRDALQMMLDHHEPYPAMVVDRDWNLLMHNGMFPLLFDLIGGWEAAWQRTCGDGARNVMRLTFHSEGLRANIANWDAVAPLLLQRMRREATATCSEALGQLLRELLADPSIPREWHAPDIERALPPVLPLSITAGDLQVSLFSVISTFGTAQDVTTDEIRVESFFPADTATADLLRSLT